MFGEFFMVVVWILCLGWKMGWCEGERRGVLIGRKLVFDVVKVCVEYKWGVVDLWGLLD